VKDDAGDGDLKGGWSCSTYEAALDTSVSIRYVVWPSRNKWIPGEGKKPVSDESEGEGRREKGRKGLTRSEDGMNVYTLDVMSRFG
jgi:hypothetical protein